MTAPEPVAVEAGLVERLRLGEPGTPGHEVVWVQNLRAFIATEMFRTFPEWRAIFLENVNALFLAAGEAASALSSLQEQVEALTREKDEAMKVLRDHHKWHAESGILGIPDGDGGWIEMDNAAEYGDSRLYERTAKVLAILPPEHPVTPRGGRASNHWENWQLAYREMKTERRAKESAEAEVTRLRQALDPLLDAATGLSFGTDWNNGTHAKLHGYRQKLLDAIPAARRARKEPNNV